MSGFPKRSESPCDPFNTGHSSTSISAGLGMVKARDLKGENYSVVSVIGDGALTGGMAFEAINNAAKLNTNFIIVLNDNNMSISENVGGISKYLNGIRSAQGYLTFKEDIYHRLLDTKHGESLVQGIKHVKKNVKRMMVPGAYFEDLGLLYMGPVDGHDIITMRRMLTEAKKVDGPVLLHVLTHKGKGYAPAERHPARFHGAEPFDIETGLPSHPRTKASYTDIFSTVMLKMAARKKDVVAITAAMPDGVGLKRFRNVYPDRFFDVGIAEQHAVTFAAGLAAGGLHPVVAVYSSFLQRAYDQIIHDVCLQNLPVVFAVDRAGLVGSDGETHQGIFDLSYMTSIPNLTVMAPKNKWELSDMLKFAFDMQSPVAIRYPRGEAYDGLAEWRAPIEMGKSESIYEEEDICLVAFGSMVKTAVEVRKKLKEKGYACSLVNARFAKPVDEEMLKSLEKDHKLVVTLEENVEQGGFGEAVLEICVNRNLSFDVLNIALPDMYVEHGNVDILKQEIGVDPDSITKRIISRYVGL
jgi:1-deoxy-D-xylulose-5-phosphate synthase